LRRLRPESHLAAASIISDRGEQYAAEPYRRELAEHGLVGSMSRRGNPYDLVGQLSGRRLDRGVGV
jgi:transposase InsO family protein